MTGAGGAALQHRAQTSVAAVLIGVALLLGCAPRMPKGAAANTPVLSNRAETTPAAPGALILRLDQGRAAIAVAVDINLPKGDASVEVALPAVVRQQRAWTFELPGLDADEVEIEVQESKAIVSFSLAQPYRGVAALVYREPKIRYQLGHSVAIEEHGTAPGTAQLQSSLTVESAMVEDLEFVSLAAPVAARDGGARSWRAMVLDPPLVVSPGLRVHRDVSAVVGPVPVIARWTFDAIPERRANAYTTVTTSQRSPLDEFAAVSYEFEVPAAVLGIHRDHGADILVYRRSEGGATNFLGAGSLAPRALARPVAADAPTPAEAGSAPPTRSMSTSAALEAGDAPVSIRVGQATTLRAERTQREFSVDRVDRRLTEEVAIVLTNDSEVPSTVVIRETMWRGLNWAIAYFNDAGAVAKESAQRVRFTVAVPARATRTVVYRVVYTW